MSAFQDMVAADNKAVFLNTDEFAEVHSVGYNGTLYELPLVFTHIKQKGRSVPAGDNMQGVHIVSATIHFALSDVEDVPEHGQIIEISDGEALGETFYRKYRIVTSAVSLEMVTLELEAYDE